MRYFLFSLSLLLAFLAGTSSCKREVGPTDVTVDDSVRHYYPMVLGEELNLTYLLTNIGKEPLVITDIQPSCGCIIADKDNDLIVFPGKEVKLNFVFDSSKNLGVVDHTIRIYGNVKPKGVIELRFDVHVVPPAEYTPDYEETYEKKLKEQRLSGMKDAVDGKASQKGYFTDEGDNTDSRTHTKYPWRE